ncbi:aluminium induced protein with YGL and LRDR motifs, partial [Striga asiatica]
TRRICENEIREKIGTVLIFCLRGIINGLCTLAPQYSHPSGFIVYSSRKQNPLLPRLFPAVDGIFCLFQGHTENITPLKQLYGLTKTANEVSIIIEAYRTPRDRGPYPANHVVRDLKGKFAFDADGSVPFFWGVDMDDSLVFSDDEAVVKKACWKVIAMPFLVHVI